jgi:hypothetical protein
MILYDIRYQSLYLFDIYYCIINWTEYVPTIHFMRGSLLWMKLIHELKINFQLNFNLTSWILLIEIHCKTCIHNCFHCLTQNLPKNGIIQFAVNNQWTHRPTRSYERKISREIELKNTSVQIRKFLLCFLIYEKVEEFSIFNTMKWARLSGNFWRINLR